MWALMVAQFFYALGDGFLYPFVAFFLTRDFHLSMADAGLLMGLVGIGYIVGQLPSGYFTDRYGARLVAALAYAVASISIIAAGLVHNLWLWTCLYGLGLIMVGAAFPAVIQAITLSVKQDNRTQGYSAVILAQNAGIIIGPLLGLSLALYQFQWIFWIDGICLGVSSVLLLRGVSRRSFPSHLSPSTSFVSFWRSCLYFPPWKKSEFWTVALGGTLMGVIYSQLVSTLPMEMEHSMSVLHWYGLLWAMNGALITILQWPVSFVLRHWNRRLWMGLGAVLYTFAMIVLGVGGDIFLVAVAFLIVTLGELIYEPLPPTEYAAQAPTGYGARYQGAGSFFSAFGMVIGPILGSALLANAGHLVLWLAMGAFGLIAAVLVAHRPPSYAGVSELPNVTHPQHSLK